MSWWRRFCADQNGNIAILFAAGMAVSAVVSAFAVDAASLYNERRTVQSAVDLAALMAARDPANAFAIARGVLDDAGLVTGSVSVQSVAVVGTSGTSSTASTSLVVQPGRYVADPGVAPAQRFVVGQQPINAVRVRFEQPGTLYFAKSWSPVPVISAAAISTTNPQVSFSIGSRLASLNGGIANSVLNTLLGTSVSLTALDYNGLLNAKINVFGFLDAMAQQLNITAGTYDTVLSAKADHGKIAAAIATLLTGSEKLAAQKIASKAGGNGRVALSSLFDLGDFGAMTIGSGGAGATFTTISALEVLAVSAGLSDGTHQLALGLTAAVPGLVGISVSLAVGEPAQGGSWYAIGPNSTVVRTAQVRLKITASLLGGPVLLGAGVNLPLYLEVAQAEAVVGSASCPTGSDASGSATILTKPGVARLILGDVDASSFGNFNTTPNVGVAKLVDVLLLKITGSAAVDVAQQSPISLSFSPSEIAANTVKTARTSTMVSSLTGSLLGNLTLNINVLGLGLASPALIGSTLKALLSPVTSTLDLTIDTLLQALGLSMGEADVQVHGVTCTHPVLVG